MRKDPVDLAISIMRKRGQEGHKPFQARGSKHLLKQSGENQFYFSKSEVLLQLKTFSYFKVDLRGMEWGGRREEGSGWGTHVYLWRIHFDIWQI